MIKKDLQKDMTDFLQMLNKLSNKKRRQIIKNKQKASIREISLKKAIINSLENSYKKQLPVFIPVTKISKSKAKDIYIAEISMNIYYIACYLKKAQIFAISKKDILYQAEKEARAKTKSKIVICQEYHNFLDVFSKKHLDTLLPHKITKFIWNKSKNLIIYFYTRCLLKN